MGEPVDRESLLAELGRGATFRYRLFWNPDPADPDSCLSQWWPCAFDVGGQPYTSAEQFMMAGKAKVFGDAATCAAILAEQDPAVIKSLGRRVANFDSAAWAAARVDVVLAGNRAKFGSDPALREHLLSTGDDVLVEASPDDAVWGIGLAAGHPDAAAPHRWPGRNLLGFALARVRAELRLSAASDA